MNNYEVIKFEIGQDAYESAAGFEQTTETLYAGRQEIETWDLKGNRLQSIKPEKPVDALGASREYFASANGDANSVYIYDRNTGKKVKTIGSDKIESLYDMQMDPLSSTIAVWDMPYPKKSIFLKLFNIHGEQMTQFPLSTNMEPAFFDFQFNQKREIFFNYMNVTDNSPSTDKKNYYKNNMVDCVKNKLSERHSTHKMAIYNLDGSPEYVWDVAPSPCQLATSDAEGNIVIPGGNSKIYYYKQTGDLLKKLDGDSFFCRPVMSNSDDTIYYIKNNWSSHTTTMIGLDPETNTNITEFSFTYPSDVTGNSHIFLDQWNDNVIILLNKYAYVLVPKNK